MSYLYSLKAPGFPERQMYAANQNEARRNYSEIYNNCPIADIQCYWIREY